MKVILKSRAYLIVVLILLLLAPCMTAYGDTIRLKNLGVDIEGEITGLTQDFIGVAISEKDIKSVTIQPGNQQAYPDIIFFLVSGFEFACKVTSINTDAIGIRIPKSEAVSLRMVFAPGLSKGGKEVGAGLKPAPISSEQVLSPIRETEAPATTPVSPPLALRQEIRREAEPPVNRVVAKEKIKREVMQELEAEKASKEEAWQSPWVFKEEIKKELKEEFEAKRAAEKKVFQETNLGRVEGRILRKGQPLPDCEVKIVMLVKAKIPLAGSFYQPEMPAEYEGITDSEGRYHLINVAPGEYKICWKPRTESGWVRRLEIKPDVIVEVGKTTYPKDIETFKRVIN